MVYSPILTNTPLGLHRRPNLKLKLLGPSAVPHLGVYPKDLKSTHHRVTRTSMLWNQSTCPVTEE